MLAGTKPDAAGNFFCRPAGLTLPLPRGILVLLNWQASVTPLAMNNTQLSLLLRVQSGDTDAWQRFDSLYRPFIRAWLTRLHVHPQDADDLTQDVLLAIVRGIEQFRHPGRPGSFRGWLRAITANCARAFWRASPGRAAPGGEAFLRAVEGLEDPASSVSSVWDRAHDQAVLQRLLELLSAEVEPRTMRAFRMLVFEGRTGADAAAELGMTVAAVYAAKSRVLSRLRAEARDLLDGFPPA